MDMKTRTERAQHFKTLLQSSEVKETLSPSQVGYLLEVHPITVQHWINQGQLQAEKIEGRWRILFSDLENYVNSRVEKEIAREKNKADSQMGRAATTGRHSS